MSFFSKLFHRKDEFEDDERDHISSEGNSGDSERITVRLPFTVLYYSESEIEVGYEGEFDWYEVPTDYSEKMYYYPVGCFVDTDELGRTDATRGIRRLTELFENREREDARVKQAVADHFTGEDGIVTNDWDQDWGALTKEEFLKELEVRFITVYRDGRTAFSLINHAALGPDDDIHVVFDEAGEASFYNAREFYNF